MLKDFFDEVKYEELKNSTNDIYKALEISTNLFKHDTDKGGYPYIIHLMYVYRHVHTIDSKIVALLHDVMEDKNVSAEDLIDIGFNKNIVDDVSVLTRKKKTEYKDYIDNIVKNGSICALQVKLADLKNNMDMSRIKNPTISDYERVEKRYTPAYEKILNRLKIMEEL